MQFEHQQDSEVVEEAAVQYQRNQRSQSALSSWSIRFGAVGIKLTQNFEQEKHVIKKISEQFWCYSVFYLLPTHPIKSSASVCIIILKTSLE